MPTLHWIGKEKVVNHHQDVPFRVLEHQYGFDADNGELDQQTDSGNKIIHGDNLEALKSLLPEYEGKVKCIYIDPPYNTGNESWVYNDNVSHPKIKKWLGEVVGKEGDDLSRHDKWLCMMYPRLKLLHRLLANDGAIFVSIDENEVSNLKLLMEEVFGARNFIEQIVWNKRVPKNDKYIGNIHEYILLFVKSRNYDHKFTQIKEGIKEVRTFTSQLRKNNVPLPKAEEQLKNFYKKNKYRRGITLYNSLDKDYKPWGKINVSWPNAQSEGPRYDVIHPDTGKPCKVPKRGWRWTKETFDAMLDYENVEELHDGSFICGNIWFAEDENTQPSSIKYLNDVSTLLLRSIISTKSEGSIALANLTDEKFDYPKPINLIEKLLNSVDTTDGIFLDSFAGSGTTAHAVQNLNVEDGGNRKFILVEMEEYANSITAERVKRVMKGYGKGKKKTEGTGGSFDYYQLGLPLFDENDLLKEEIEEFRIREYVWYSETKTAFPKERSKSAHEHLLGTKDETDYYFYYEKEVITTLNHDFLATITQKADQYVIYADNCLLSKKFMREKNIIFKKIPRDVTRF